MNGIFLTLPIFIIGLLLFLYFVPLGLWIQSGVSIGWGKVGMVKLVIMRIRKIPPKLMADGIINLHRAGLDFVTSEELETHFLAGGNVQNVVDAIHCPDGAGAHSRISRPTCGSSSSRSICVANLSTHLWQRFICCGGRRLEAKAQARSTGSAPEARV